MNKNRLQYVLDSEIDLFIVFIVIQCDTVNPLTLYKTNKFLPPFPDLFRGRP